MSANKAMLPDKYQLPTSEGLLDEFHVFSSVPGVRNLSVFVTHAGAFPDTTMPFGLSSAHQLLLGSFCAG